jgi:hypothetical protein
VAYFSLVGKFPDRMDFSTVLFPLLYSVLQFFPLISQSTKGADPYRKACRSRGIKVAAPPLESLCDRPVTYPGDVKTLIKSSKGRSGPTLDMTTRLGLTDKELGN